MDLKNHLKNLKIGEKLTSNEVLAPRPGAVKVDNTLHVSTKSLEGRLIHELVDCLFELILPHFKEFRMQFNDLSNVGLKKTLDTFLKTGKTMDILRGPLDTRTYECVCFHQF